MIDEAEFDDAINQIAEASDAGEDSADPLAGLVEKSAADPGAAFAPDILERLAALKKGNQAAFELLRSKLKQAGCRVTKLDEAIAEKGGHGGGRGPTQAEILIKHAQAAELFHTPDGTGYADIYINGHRETWPVRAKGFRRWLARQFFEETGGAPSSEALQSALNVIEAKAQFDAPERVVYIRVGGLDGQLYLDLGDDDMAGGRDRRHRLARHRQSAGSLSPRRRHASRYRSPVRADRSRRCGRSSTCSRTPTSCSSSPGRWPCCAIAAPIRSSC